MNPKVRIVTDSTAYLPKEILEKYPFIDVVPLTVNFEDTDIVDWIENNDLFVEKLKKAKKTPTTSKPSPAQFIEVFKPAVEEGCEVVCINISANLSGTPESALAAAREIDESKIHVIDSKLTAGALEFLVEEAAELAAEGKTAEEIVGKINESIKKTKIIFMPATLEYLRRGGRIGNAQALIGTIMNIKPILHVNEDGLVDALDKVRTTKKAYKRIIDEIPYDAQKIKVCHLVNREEAEKLKELISEKVNVSEIEIVELGPVITVHAGPGVVGAIFRFSD